jgi:hypothetical protein
MAFIKRCAHCNKIIMVPRWALKRKRFCSVDCRDKSKIGKRASPATEFKKGHRPHNWVPVGSETTAPGYVKIKVAEPNVWRRRSSIVFEEAYGEVLPDGWILRHIDGDPMNDDLENLKPMPRSKHLQKTLEDPVILGRLRKNASKRQKRLWEKHREDKREKELEQYDSYYWQ